METVVLKVEGMSCAHCEKRVVKALMEVAGVKEATASAAEKKATVQGTGLDLGLLKAAVEDAGYTVID